MQRLPGVDAIIAVGSGKGGLTFFPNVSRRLRWFAEGEFGWKDARKEPPTDTLLVLLKDTKLSVVHLRSMGEMGIFHHFGLRFLVLEHEAHR